MGEWLDDESSNLGVAFAARSWRVRAVGGAAPIQADAGEREVYIIWPPDGQVIRGGFWVRMGLSRCRRGAGRRREGESPATTTCWWMSTCRRWTRRSRTTATTCISASARPRRGWNCRPAGTRLQLLLADENHVPHQPPLYSKRITVTVLPPCTRLRAKETRAMRGRPRPAAARLARPGSAAPARGTAQPTRATPNPTTPSATDAATAAAAPVPRAPAPRDAYVYIGWPQDGRG